MSSNVGQWVRCGECGIDVSEAPNLPAHARLPCPSCGSISRNFGVTASDQCKATSHVSALHERQGEAIGFTESKRERRASASSLEHDGSLQLSIVGSCPQGEEDTPAACHVLLERLKQDGAPFDEVLSGSEPADCILTDSHNPSVSLKVQVVRAIVSQDLWRRLANTGATQTTLKANDIVQEMHRSIALKATNRKLPARERAELVLALDATRLPGLAFDAVVREFRTTMTAWAACQAFQAIWLIGPTTRLAWRLDRLPWHGHISKVL
jgi:hypothetical protein